MKSLVLYEQSMLIATLYLFTQKIKDLWIGLYAFGLVLTDVFFTSLVLGIPEIRPSAILFPDFEHPSATTVSH